MSVFQNRTELVEVIRAHVQYDRLSYIGICGGAKMFGKSYHGVDTGIRFFDFLEGISLQCDACVGPKMVTATSNHNKFQITSGCGIALYLHNSEYVASSLPVVKNGDQWRKVAALNSQLLMHLSVDFLHTWYEYCDSMGPWNFRLDGFCWYQGRYFCTNLPVT